MIFSARGRNAVEAPPTCGVISTFGVRHSGWSGGSGSGSVTSSAARRRPEAHSAISASVRTTMPRATFTNSAPSFMRDRNAASTMPRVSSVAGTTMITTSAWGSSVSISLNAWIPSRAERATRTTSTSKPARRRSMADPMEP
ncbi:MAG: hypothetical protein AUG49_16635 [Catenulispora sp. 13_1_20CM_3_70_7]|nr:MAG: hypothetical protein AUG49_16635 [Catenulispora sp. 13_1_20CM_3_70_7]